MGPGLRRAAAEARDPGLLQDPLAEAVIARRVRPGIILRAFRKGDAVDFEEMAVESRPAASG